jgi:hypothetical protein
MPIEPPTPTGDVLDALNAARTTLLTLSEANPGNLLIKDTLGAVEMAITTMTEFKDMAPE